LKGRISRSYLSKVTGAGIPKLQGVETKNMGLTLYQELRRKGLPVLDLKAETDKETRALPVMARMEAGTVYFCRAPLARRLRR
jgi:predicted phage terminase large subunit-like protein